MAKIRIAIAAALALGAATAANAADIARPVYKAAPVVVPMYDWTGFYVGINGGWGRADFDHSYNISGHYNLVAGRYASTTARAAEFWADMPATTGRPGQWVFGVEGAIMKTWLDSRCSNQPVLPGDRYLAIQAGLDGFRLPAASATPGITCLATSRAAGPMRSFNDYVQDTNRLT